MWILGLLLLAGGAAYLLSQKKATTPAPAGTLSETIAPRAAVATRGTISGTVLRGFRENPIVMIPESHSIVLGEGIPVIPIETRAASSPDERLGGLDIIVHPHVFWDCRLSLRPHAAVADLPVITGFQNRMPQDVGKVNHRWRATDIRLEYPDGHEERVNSLHTGAVLGSALTTFFSPFLYMAMHEYAERRYEVWASSGAENERYVPDYGGFNHGFAFSCGDQNEIFKFNPSLGFLTQQWLQFFPVSGDWDIYVKHIHDDFTYGQDDAGTLNSTLVGMYASLASMKVGQEKAFNRRQLGKAIRIISWIIKMIVKIFSGYNLDISAWLVGEISDACKALQSIVSTLQMIYQSQAFQILKTATQDMLVQRLRRANIDISRRNLTASYTQAQNLLTSALNGDSEPFGTGDLEAPGFIYAGFKRVTIILPPTARTFTVPADAGAA